MNKRNHLNCMYWVQFHRLAELWKWLSSIGSNKRIYKYERAAIKRDLATLGLPPTSHMYIWIIASRETAKRKLKCINRNIVLTLWKVVSIRRTGWKILSKCSNISHRFLSTDVSNSIELTVIPCIWKQAFNKREEKPFIETDLLKYKAIKLLREGNPESGVAHLSNSHSVGLQHKSINIHHNLVSKRKEPVSESPEENQEENSEEHGSDNCMQCNIISHPSWLQTLPVEWTVVQISELRIGKEIFKELGGPPHPNIDLPDLVIARFRCGPSRSGFLTNELGRPTKGIECGGLLSELNSILEGNKVINKDFCGPRETYFKVRQEHHNQLKVTHEILIYSLQ